MYWKIRHILNQRGITDPPDRSFRLVDDADGNGPRIETWDVGALGAQPTPDEIASVTASDVLAAKDQHQVSGARAESRGRDRLASIAWSLRLKDPQAWSALSLEQKKAAVLAEADRWRDMRVWVEKNL